MTPSLSDLLLRSKKLHLLYVEDNDSARKFTLEMLTRFFDHITVAVDGEEGLEKFKNERFDLVLTDINMPRMSGTEMISKIREFDKDINIIVLSAHNEPNYYEEVSVYNVRYYLAKPLSVSQLIETLHQLLEDT
ncbi:MAG: response regulator [Arcobacter sp.]|nr:MAG: response regulator [Arcobacter sp.]